MKLSRSQLRNLILETIIVDEEGDAVDSRTAIQDFKNMIKNYKGDYQDQIKGIIDNSDDDLDYYRSAASLAFDDPYLSSFDLDKFLHADEVGKESEEERKKAKKELFRKRMLQRKAGIKPDDDITDYRSLTDRTIKYPGLEKFWQDISVKVIEKYIISRLKNTLFKNRIDRVKKERWASQMIEDEIMNIFLSDVYLKFKDSKHFKVLEKLENSWSYKSSILKRTIRGILERENII